MKAFALMGVALLLTGATFSQSLGDVARQNRQTKKKHAAKVYTNDEIPSVTINPPAPPEASADQKPAADAATKTDAKAAEGDVPSGEKPKKADPDEQVKKLDDRYRAQIDEQKKSIELLQREISVLEREHKIQTTVYYTDAGSRLRDPKDWTDALKRYEEDMAAKGKALDAAKAKLESLTEEARKAGAQVSQ